VFGEGRRDEAGPGAVTAGRLAPQEVLSRKFSRVVRGYRRREVNRLLRRAAADLARLRNGPPHGRPGLPDPLTPEDVERARFRPALGGYEMNEVDEFLDQVAEELGVAAHQREQLPPPPAREAEPEPVPPAPPPPPRTPAEVSRRAFSQASPGYLPDEVDRFLVRAAQALAALGAPQRPALPAPGALPEQPPEVEPVMNRWHVLRTRFPLGPRGYALHEVDAYLVELAAMFPEPDQRAQQEILRQLRLD
jgi:DivIVA domain-containing protein